MGLQPVQIAGIITAITKPLKMAGIPKEAVLVTGSTPPNGHPSESTYCLAQEAIEEVRKGLRMK